MPSCSFLDSSRWSLHDSVSIQLFDASFTKRLYVRGSVKSRDTLSNDLARLDYRDFVHGTSIFGGQLHVGMLL